MRERLKAVEHNIWEQRWSLGMPRNQFTVKRENGAQRAPVRGKDALLFKVQELQASLSSTLRSAFRLHGFSPYSQELHPCSLVIIPLGSLAMQN
jgi:hypothetical protein